MKLAVTQMGSNTAHIVSDFKQKFLVKGFRAVREQTPTMARREFCGGAGVYVKPYTGEAAMGSETTANQLYIKSEYRGRKWTMSRQKLSVQGVNCN